MSKSTFWFLDLKLIRDKNRNIQHWPDSVLLQINPVLQSTSPSMRSGIPRSSVTGSLLRTMAAARSWTTSLRRRTTRTTRSAGSPSPQPWRAPVSSSANSSRGRSTSSESPPRTSSAVGHRVSQSRWLPRTSLVSKGQKINVKRTFKSQLTHPFIWLDEKFQRILRNTQYILYIQSPKNNISNK